MSAMTYKPQETHRDTLQTLRVWQTRLDGVARALEEARHEDAHAALDDLRQRLRPEAYPEFSENIDWLYRAAGAFIDEGEAGHAHRIVSSLRQMLEGACRQLVEGRSTRNPFGNGTG